MNRLKIKFRNFWLSIGDQVFRKKAFYSVLRKKCHIFSVTYVATPYRHTFENLLY